MFSLYLLAAFRQNGPLRRRVLGALRVCVYALVMTSVSGFFTARSALGLMREQLKALGAELLPLADLLEGATPLRINGETLIFSSTFVRDTSVRQVLDRVQAHCEENPGPLTKRLRGLLANFSDGVSGRDALARDILSRLALTRDESEQSGFIQCMTGSSSASESSVDELGDDLDLGKLGNLRYVMVDRGGPGEGNVARVISLVTEGPFHLGSLTPPALGDAKGSDSARVPRPPNSTRLFSLEALGSPYAVRIYETSTSAAKVLEFYDRELRDWNPVTLPENENVVHGYVKGAIPVVVGVAREQSKNVVTISEFGGPLDAKDLGLRVRK